MLQHEWTLRTVKWATIDWNKPITKQHVLYDSIMWVIWGGRIHRNGKSSGGYQELGEGEVGSCYLMSMKFHFERWKSSGDWLHNSGNLLSDTGLLRWFSGKESVCQCRRCRFDAWVGKIPGRRQWQSIQYSCLRNPMDRGAWWVPVHGVTEKTDMT